MRISIALATFNGAAYIEEQLQSFAAQTRLLDELVICDDRSTDNTVDLIERFAASAPFAVRVEVNPENLGITGNFNRALGLCTGDLVFLSDQDDIWFAEKLAVVADHAERDPAALAFLNDQIVGNADLSALGQRKAHNVLAMGHSIDSMITGCCTALRRELLDIVLPLYHDAAHDQWIGDIAIGLGVRRFIDQPLQYYRRHGANASSWAASSIDAVGPQPLRRLNCATVRNAWTRRIGKLEAMTERILSIRERPSLREAADRMIEKLEVERGSLTLRLQIAAIPRLRRIAPVTLLLLRGGYSGARSWRSAANDVLR